MNFSFSSLLLSQLIYQHQDQVVSFNDSPSHKYELSPKIMSNVLFFDYQKPSNTNFHSILKLSPVLSLVDFSEKTNPDYQHVNKKISFTKCNFQNVSGKEFGGALHLERCEAIINQCIFKNCQAKYGSAFYFLGMKQFSFSFSLIMDCHSERFGGAFIEGEKRETSILIENSNFSNCVSDFYISCLRIENCSPLLNIVSISHCSSSKFGAIWDWTPLPGMSHYTLLNLVNNSSGSEGAGFTSFHWLSSSIFNKCNFVHNVGPVPRSIYFFSIDATSIIDECYFSENKDQEIGTHYGDCNISIRSNCKFHHKFSN